MLPLCGTKVMRLEDYRHLANNLSYFGDFDLLFGAAKLNLKIVEMSVHYRSRTYGDTNINRWRHGWMLLKMLVFRGPVDQIYMKTFRPEDFFVGRISIIANDFLPLNYDEPVKGRETAQLSFWHLSTRHSGMLLAGILSFQYVLDPPG